MATRGASAKPRPDATLIRALARAHRWKRLLEEGRYRSANEIADVEGVTRSFVNRMMRLTLLAPDIVEAIPEGAAAEGVAAEGKYRSAGELAEAEGVVTRLLRLTQPALRIVEAILEGRRHKGVVLDESAELKVNNCLKTFALAPISSTFIQRKTTP